MGLVITPQEKIDEYFESTALSQSQLKKLLIGIDAFLANEEEDKKLYYEEKGHFIIGSAVDLLLTGEKEEFDNKYYVSMLDKKPSDVEMSITALVLRDVEDSYVSANIPQDYQTLDKYPGSIQMAIEEHDWQRNWKLETRINKIIENCSEYFEDLKKGIGKQVLSTTEKKLIDDIVFSLRSNPVTGKYFDRNKLAKDTNITVYYQLPIYFYYNNIYCKALLDMLIVGKNDKGKIVMVEPIDLKTMNGSTLRFPNNLKSFRYDIQAAWYVEALIAIDSTFTLEITREMISPFKFIVESNSIPGKPLIYEIDDETLEIGKNGKPDIIIKRPNYAYDELVQRGVKGFNELLDTYIYQNENDWQEEQIITKNKGVLKIGWNGIKD